MTEINDKKFLTRIFISNSGVSSRRVLAFVFSVVLIFQSFMHYEFKTLQLMAFIICILLGLTTFSSSKFGGEQHKEEENGGSENGTIKG
jgi:hypothetical protein